MFELSTGLVPSSEGHKTNPDLSWIANFGDGNVKVLHSLSLKIMTIHVEKENLHPDNRNRLLAVGKQHKTIWWTLAVDPHKTKVSKYHFDAKFLVLDSQLKGKVVEIATSVPRGDVSK